MADKNCTLVFLRRENQILLAMKKRGFGSDRWNGVGGKIEPHETIGQALVRESQEEVGVTPLQWEKVAVHDFEMDVDSDEPWHMYVHAYLCDSWEDEPHESEEMAPQWFNVADIPYGEMWQDDIVWLPQVLNGKKLRCTFAFKRDESMLSAHMELVDGLADES